jgi:hypothetical protein
VQRKIDIFLDAWKHEVLHMREILLVLVIISVILSACTPLSGEAQKAVKPEKPQSIDDLNAGMDSALHRFQASEDTKAKKEAADELWKVAKQRQTLMKKLAIENPRAFTAKAMSQSERELLPFQTKELVERYIPSIEGVLDVRHYDNFESETIQYRNFLIVDEGTAYEIPLQEDIPDGSRIELKDAYLIDDVIASEEAVLAIGARPVPGSPNDYTGVRKILIVPFNWQDYTSQPFSHQQIVDATFGALPTSLKSRIQEFSNGKLTMTGDVAPWITVPLNRPVQECAYATELDWLSAQLPALGYDKNSYDYVSYIFPPIWTQDGRCWWTGVGGTNGWILNGVNTNTGTAIHEMGHSFTLPHAGRIRCGLLSMDDYSSCTILSTGDQFSKMSYVSDNQFNGVEKVKLGWANFQDIVTDGVYTVGVLENDQGINALKIYKPDTQDWYYVSYRQPLGNFDANLPARATWGASIHAQLLDLEWIPLAVDMNPSTTDIEVLADGQTFTDTLNGITIRQLSHDSMGVILDIDVPQGCVLANPLLQIKYNTNIKRAAGGMAEYYFNLTNNNNNICPPSQFDFSADFAGLPPGWSASFVPDSQALFSQDNTGDQSLLARITSPSDIPVGTYTITIKAQDRMNPAYSDTAQVTYQVVNDLEPPKVSFKAPANGVEYTNENPADLFQAILTSSDDVSLELGEIYVNRVLQYSKAKPTYGFSPVIGTLQQGMNSVSAIVYDAVGKYDTAVIIVNQTGRAHRWFEAEKSGLTGPQIITDSDACQSSLQNNAVLTTGSGETLLFNITGLPQDSLITDTYAYVWARLKTTQDSPAAFLVNFTDASMLGSGVATWNVPNTDSQFAWVRVNHLGTPKQYQILSGGLTYPHKLLLTHKQHNVVIDAVYVTTDPSPVISGCGGLQKTQSLPVVGFDMPLKNEAYWEEIPIVIHATDPDGIASVDFFVNGQLYTTMTSPPYGLALDVPSLGEGQHVLTVRASDMQGDSNISSIVIFADPDAIPPVQDDDNTPPSVTILSPIGGSTIRGSFMVRARITDDRALDYANLLIIDYNGPRIIGRLVQNGIDTYEFLFDTTQFVDGMYGISVVALDTSMNVGSDRKDVLIDNIPEGSTNTKPPDKKPILID